MKENYFLDDGAYLCTKIIIKAAQLRKEGKELDELTAALKEPVESKEVRFKILSLISEPAAKRLLMTLPHMQWRRTAGMLQTIIVRV